MLRVSGDEALAQLRALPADTYERGRYENGWNARQILAHVASIEWTYQRLIGIAREAQAEPALAESSAEVRRVPPEDAGGLPTRPAQGGIDAYNERQVAKRAGASIDDLLDEFARNREATIAAVEAADEALFDASIRSAGGITGPLGGVLRTVAVEHVMGHVTDITGAPWAGRRW